MNRGPDDRAGLLLPVFPEGGDEPPDSLIPEGAWAPAKAGMKSDGAADRGLSGNVPARRDDP